MRRTNELVIFDLDGVIYRGDTFFRFVLHLTGVRPVRLAQLARTLPSGVHSLIRPETRGLALGRIVKAAVGHLTLEQYHHVAEAFGLRLARAHGARAGALSEINSHLKDGATVVVATASEITLAGAYLQGVGLGHVPVVGSTITAPSAGFASHARGLRKLAALEAAGYCAPFSTVYTDSAADLPLLARTAAPVLVNASKQTVAAVTARLGVRPREVTW